MQLSNNSKVSCLISNIYFLKYDCHYNSELKYIYIYYFYKVTGKYDTLNTYLNSLVIIELINS